MTRYWPTLLMAGVFAGLGLYLYFIELPEQRTEEHTAAEATRIVPFNEAEMTSLIVKSQGGEVTLSQAPGQPWSITAPIRSDADQRQVQALLRALVTGKVSRLVETRPASLVPFGLDHPSTVVTIDTGTKQETLSIGDAGPLSSTLYVLRGSDQAVLLTDLAPKDFLNKTLLSFRRKELLQFSTNDAERLRLTYPTTEIVLYAVDEKPKKKWKIRYPIEAEGDRTEVQALLFRLEDLKALAIVDPGPERDALLPLLVKPKVKVALQAAGPEQTVRLFQPDPASGEAYAQTTPDGPIFKVSPSAIKDLTKDLFALQDKRLLGAEINDIALLSIKTRDEQYVLVRDQNEWVLEDRPTTTLRQDVADLLVSRIVNLPAEERVLKQAGPLAPYGLTAPVAEFVATGKDGRTVGRLALGSQVGGLVYAIGQRIPGIFQARPDLLTQIPSRPTLLGQSHEQETTR
ncbi:DUF4340 domain-containing protein [Nitrospirales bacterium NOB]|nr:hypothetical protein [Nitrospirota bacterium]MCE7965375.1 DUF4340 domain-containing protein [Nitrospira sp. NTP2]MCK6493405.1 DUF4340 domain-containing protein [Nitrospira sp.]MDL1888618.1 DUF4340 domain-containing protein [Nitrospirales bacterium NOB]MEB2338949.1 DUF4340 domain-containing protein [Nitrospirales bacterium]